MRKSAEYEQVIRVAEFVFWPYSLTMSLTLDKSLQVLKLKAGIILPLPGSAVCRKCVKCDGL